MIDLKRRNIFFNAMGMVLKVQILLMVTIGASAESISIIVNTSVNVDRLTVLEIKEIYRKEMQSWNSGKTIVVLDQADGTGAHRLFLKKVMQKTVAEWESFWIERKHLRGDQAPQQIPSDSMMVQMVDSIEGAIGFVETSFFNEKGHKRFKVKTVAIIED